MSILHPHIAARIFNTPLMIEAGKAVAILTAIGGRIVDGGVVIEDQPEALQHIAFEAGRPSMGRIGDRLGRAYQADGYDPLDVVSNVAVIPIEGSLVHKGGYVGKFSGRTSYQGLQTQIAAAARRPDVKGVVFEVDSFGGEASGVFETADMIASLSAAKPTLSILTDHAASAGYLLASAARQMVAPKNGTLGSIGALILHVNMAAALEKEGMKVTILRAGAHKTELNPVEPLTAEISNRVTASLEQTRQSFAEAVGKYRGARFTTERALATEAQVYGGEEAVTLGLADGIGHGNQIFDAFVREVNRR